VAGVAHLGDVLQFVVRTPSRDLLALIPRNVATKVLPGDPVWCTWTADNTYLFPADQAELVLVDPAAETAPI
jgi:hypothetical protein